MVHLYQRDAGKGRSDIIISSVNELVADWDDVRPATAMLSDDPLFLHDTGTARHGRNETHWRHGGREKQVPDRQCQP
ncbi:MAG: hypothetical protein EA381_01240 [Planctomycetaceae bacterium]|nr:MAG: hypothetical protein EA381_01240 [Planctomycetaceae bacterium]